MNLYPVLLGEALHRFDRIDRDGESLRSDDDQCNLVRRVVQHLARFPYYENNAWKAAQLPYAGGTYSFLVLVPKVVLQQVLSYYSRSPERPAGLSLDDTFVLPAGIREIRLDRGQAIVVQ